MPLNTNSFLPKVCATARLKYCILSRTFNITKFTRLLMNFRSYCPWKTWVALWTATKLVFSCDFSDRHIILLDFNRIQCSIWLLSALKLRILLVILPTIITILISIISITFPTFLCILFKSYSFYPREFITIFRIFTLRVNYSFYRNAFDSYSALILPRTKCFSLFLGYAMFYMKIPTLSLNFNYHMNFIYKNA